jgi:hypothetical protein
MLAFYKFIFNLYPRNQLSINLKTTNFMASTSESGHAKNVANFDTLLASITGYGATYNPSKASIKLAAMQTLSVSAKTAITNLNSALPPFSNASAAREAAFEPLNKLITRVGNAFKALDVTKQAVDNVRTLVRKVQGRRASAKLTDEEKKALEAEKGKEIVQISSSQMSYDSRLDNFDKLIKLLSSTPQYVPNESELKVAALTSLYNDLKTKNNAVIQATVPLNNARIARNTILYQPNIGLVSVAADAKLYIKSLFGATSPQYKLISKLIFKNVK